MDRRLVKIGETARLLGADPVTLRKWESTGELLPARKTKGGTRYHDVSELVGFSNEAAPTLCYSGFPAMTKSQRLIFSTIRPA